MSRSAGSDTDMISVPRGLLAAACHCVRKFAPDSTTYAELSALSLSEAPDQRIFADGLTLREIQNSPGLGLHPGDIA
jgi:hypothetical protein